MLLLELEQSREGVHHAQGLGVARENPGDERIDRVVQHLGPEPSSHEGGDRFIAVRGATTHQRLQQHPQLRAQREEPRRQHRRRRHRKCQQRAVAHDVSTVRRGIRLDDILLQVELRHQRLDRRRRHEGVGAVLRQEAVGARRANGATGMATRFVQRDVDPPPAEFVRGHESRDPSANDRDRPMVARVLIGGWHDVAMVSQRTHGSCSGDVRGPVAGR